VFAPSNGNQNGYPLITYGGGLKYFIIENLALRFDIRGYTKFRETFTNLNFTGGLSYYADLARRKDTDKDGIINRFDLCPTNPESYNGMLDEDGCPELNTPPDEKK